MSNIFFGIVLSAVAKLTAVVVLPTPPFWFATVITFVILSTDSYFLDNPKITDLCFT
jgi:hypothetical protein